MQNHKLATGAALVIGGFVLLIGWSTAFPDIPGSSQTVCPSSGEFSASEPRALTHVRFLADDALTARESGTAGADCAAAYIATRFAEIGLVSEVAMNVSERPQPLLYNRSN